MDTLQHALFGYVSCMEAYGIPKLTLVAAKNMPESWEKKYSTVHTIQFNCTQYTVTTSCNIIALWDGHKHFIKGCVGCMKVNTNINNNEQLNVTGVVYVSHSGQQC